MNMTHPEPIAEPSEFPDLTEDIVFERIKNAPTRFADLAQTTNYHSPRRKKVREIIDTLEAKGCIKLTVIHGTQFYVLANWRPGKKETLEAIDARSKRTKDGCLEWIGFFNERGEPMVWVTARNGKQMPKSVRRWLWEANGKGRLKLSDKVEPTCTNPKCVDVEHLSRRSKNANLRGTPLPVHHRLAIAKAKAAKSRFSAQDIEHIRTSPESNTALAKRYQCSRENIRQIRAHQTHTGGHLEAAGMFASLMNNRPRNSHSSAQNYP